MRVDVVSFQLHSSGAVIQEMIFLFGGYLSMNSIIGSLVISLEMNKTRPVGNLLQLSISYLTRKAKQGINMQDSKKISVPSQAGPATVHACQLSASDESLENSNPGNQSSTLLHGTEVVEGPASQTGTYLGRAGSDRDNEGTKASADPSATCTPHNLARSLGGSTETQSDLSSPSPRSRVTHAESSGSSRKWHAPMLQDWKWEILSMLTSLGLLAGILITLGRYNDGEQPEWPYNININSLVSVLTAVTIAQLGFILAESMYHSAILLPPEHPNQRKIHCVFGCESNVVPAVISQLKWSWFKEPHPLQDLEHYDAASRGILGSFIFLGRFVGQPRA